MPVCARPLLVGNQLKAHLVGLGGLSNVGRDQNVPPGLEQDSWNHPGLGEEARKPGRHFVLLSTNF